MIATVTLNPAIDKTLVVPDFAPGKTNRVEDCAARAEVVVFSGSLPPGAPPETCAALIEVATRRGAKTVLDVSGGALRAATAASGGSSVASCAAIDGLLPQVELADLGEVAPK